MWERFPQARKNGGMRETVTGRVKVVLFGATNGRERSPREYLLDHYVAPFDRPHFLTSSELIERSYRAERIRYLGQELDQIGRTAIIERIRDSSITQLKQWEQ